MDWVRPSSVCGSWKLRRRSMEAVAVAVVLVATYSIFMSKKPRMGLRFEKSDGCQFPAIYNFGDSNSDTGCVSAAFNWLRSPFGETFFGKPSGRYSDGRLIIDFIAEELGLPYLSAYLDSIGTNYQHGANFAASGSTIQQTNANLCGAGFNPLSLDIQVLQFEQFKARSIELRTHKSKTGRLPRPEDFPKALYTIDSGQNDLHAGLISVTEEQVLLSIPDIINQFSLDVEKLYKLGARAFWIHNTGPIGCLPYLALTYSPKPGNRDQNGCVKSYNEVAQEFNKQLKERVYKLRTQLKDAQLTFADIYSVKYYLISHAKEHGKSD
ncbi:unnamed protein product [Ilex paraguariensis]|uniref:GDSL esterase/lipase n=1 Tax=Ilex paraguariensis TaxID=185542 RepID=A0ABC8U2M5_9AQUA